MAGAFERLTAMLEGPKVPELTPEQRKAAPSMAKLTDMLKKQDGWDHGDDGGGGGAPPAPCM